MDSRIWCILLNWYMANMYHHLLSISYLLSHYFWKSINKCDPSEQKQPFGCTLTNPPHVTPLRPGSTFIDGFSRAIYQKIATTAFNSYPLRYQYWKSVNNCGVGTQWRNVWWIRQSGPKRLRSEGSQMKKLGLPFFLNYDPLNIFVNISNCRHFIIYWWIFKSSGSKESSCGIEYDTYGEIHGEYVSFLR